MHILRGIWRLTIFSLALSLGTIVVLALAWLPIRVRGVRLSAWPTVALARFFTRLFNVHYTCEEVEKIRQHQGFIFPNHNSVLDIILLLHIIPTRFLAKAEVRGWPFIGWIGTAVDSVYVDRGNKASRTAARNAIAKIDPYPPVTIFPEGGIFVPAEKLHPFRYGAFEIAVQNEIPFMPVVFLYEPIDVVFWGDESLLTSVWRFATFRGPIQARLYALRVVQPQPGDDPKQLALETHGAMEAAFIYGGHEEDIIESGI
ncbi:MAG: 1-acyl-sn-glycerol-3-phosphate acyltransferase [Chloroflexi bacterium]|nr:1-acyl-sn-glycerol-3-phosphate acyltransferase [Chloroflexota bacterium]